MKRLSQILLLLLLIAAPLFVLGLHQQWWSVPRHWNPFMPLHVTDPVTPVTGWKLSRLEDRPQACLDALNTAPEDALDHLPLEDYTPVESCPLTNVVRVRRTGVTFNNSFVARCPLALAWVMFERHDHADHQHDGGHRQQREYRPHRLQRAMKQGVQQGAGDHR